jgi:outer membrane protein
MRTWRTLALSASSLFIAGVFAQDTLQLADAIQLAMANEHGIRIAKNDAAIAQAQATVGNAGLLPSLDASGRANYSNQYSKLDFAPGIQDVERSGVESTTLAGQVGLAYTLFNGMGNFATYERAQLNELLADLRTRAQVEGTLSQVIALYYGIAAMDEDVAITQRILEISADRFARQEGKASLGGVGRLDVLNAKVDLQADSTTYILAKQRRDRSVRDLNVLMGRSSATSMQVSRRVDHVRVLAEDQLVQEAMNGNVLLVSATAQVRAAEVDQRIAKALRWPKLDLNAAYGINDQKNEVGVVLGTYTQGFNGGLTVSVPLFNGGRITTQMEAARLRAENAVIAEQQARLQVERDVRNAYATWSSQREVLRIQSDAVNTAQINFERTRELFQADSLPGCNSAKRSWIWRMRKGSPSSRASIPKWRS